MNELTGKRALVTGSKSGIGFAIAKRLAEAGQATPGLGGRKRRGKKSRKSRKNVKKNQKK